MYATLLLHMRTLFLPSLVSHICGGNMDAVTFGKFLQSDTYASKDSFFHEACACGDCLEFVKFGLGLRVDSWTGGPLFGVFWDECFNLWRYMHQCCLLGGMSRNVRPKLAPLVVCKHNAPALSLGATLAAPQLWSKMAAQPWMAWFDNFYRRLFIRTPHEGSKSLNYTAIALLPMSQCLPIVTRWPRCETLTASIPGIGTDLCTLFDCLVAGVKDFMQHLVGLRYLCCLLDMQRLGLHSQPWPPFMIIEAQIREKDDIVMLLHTIADIQKPGSNRCGRNRSLPSDETMLQFDVHCMGFAATIDKGSTHLWDMESL